MDHSAPRVPPSIFKRYAEPYQYSSLDEENHEIRLLTLLPGRFSEDIHISLRHDYLTPAHIPEYEALSYVWGSTKRPQRIFLDAPDRPKQKLAVNQNLATALRHFRLEDQNRVMWIDAICINQTDLVERSKQVQHMADIYKLASRVVIWLGEEKDRSTVALRALEEINNKVDVSFKNGTLKSKSQESSEQHWDDYNELSPLEKEQWLAVTSLLARPWFERLWIWQEARLGNQHSIVMCGLVELHWSTFRSSVFVLSLKPAPWYLSTTYPQNVRRAADLSDRDDNDFRRIAENTKFSKFEDPRDRVYALLSILPADDYINLAPDYTKSVAEVYRDVFEYHVEKFRSLDFLRSSEYHQSDDKDHNMPTWVPD